MIFTSWLISLIGEVSENVTFYENSTTREINLTFAEGFYIPNYINSFSAYNLSGINWTPFWVNSSDALTSGEYDIYSYRMQVNQSLTLPSGAFSIFNEPRSVISFKTFIELINVSQVSSLTNITHDIGLIYDNETGVLLKGMVVSSFSNATNTKTYQVEMNLISSTLFANNESAEFQSTEIDTENIPIQITFPPPNYLVLGLIMVSPLVMVTIRIVRLKEIKGGV
jgi:hypothetical protein